MGGSGAARGSFVSDWSRMCTLDSSRATARRLGEPSLCRTQVLMHLEALVRFRADVIAWHLASAIKEGGVKATDTLGNSSIREAVKRVIRRTQ